MRDEPNVELKGPNSVNLDTTKGVDSYRQQDSGHGSRNLLRSV
jgi:hypothetical protein